MAAAVRDFEIHSELALVCPEVRRQALAVLASERSLHLLRYPGASAPSYVPTRLALALALYVARTLAKTTVLVAATMSIVVAFALALELLARL